MRQSCCCFSPIRNFMIQRERGDEYEIKFLGKWAQRSNKAVKSVHPTSSRSFHPVSFENDILAENGSDCDAVSEGGRLKGNYTHPNYSRRRLSHGHLPTYEAADVRRCWQIKQIFPRAVAAAFPSIQIFSLSLFSTSDDKVCSSFLSTWYYSAAQRGSKYGRL